ncbi:tetratricopeptide repeat protein [bacterium]|nr:tetratricopeptide repeat protein [bacterium]MBU1753185.1 tetratricopeptide repeat protein [bacterium]
MNYAKRLNEAIQLKNNRKLDEALAIFLELIDEQPQDDYLLSNLGHLYFKMNNYENSLIMIERACNIKKQGEFVLKLKADVLMRLGRVDEAENILVEMLSRGFNLDVIKRLIKCLIEQKRFGDALNQINRALQVVEYDRDMEITHGEVLVKLDKFDDASDCFKRIISHNPSDEFAYLRLIMIKLEHKSHEEVVEELRGILKIPSRSANAYLHDLLARAYKETKRYEDALREYQESLRLKPDNLFTRKQLGFCYARMKDYDGVINTLSCCLLNDPDDIYVRNSLFSAYRQTKRLKDMEELIAELIAKYPDNKKLFGIMRKLKKELKEKEYEDI